MKIMMEISSLMNVTDMSPSHNKCQSVSQLTTKVIQHGRLYRNSFGLYIEELFYLNSRETLERLGTFLQVAYTYYYSKG